MRAERFINSLDFQYLSNTIELDLSNIFGKGMFPSRREIHSFIAEEMKVTAAMISGVQHHPRFPKVHLKFERQEDMEAVELRLKDGLKMKNKNLTIFGYRCDCPMVTIILNGQSMDIKKDEIQRVMEKYGKVVTCEPGRNHDLSTKDKFVTDGTWTIRMNPKLNTKPPETIYYFGERDLVQTWILNYDGVGSSCVLCGQQGHMGFRCTSTVPRGGKMGLCPAGLGDWTDVVSKLEPVVTGAVAGVGDDQGGQQQGGQQQGGQQQGGRQHEDQQQDTSSGSQALSQGGGNPGVDVDRNGIFKKLARAGGLTASQPASVNGRVASGNVRAGPGKKGATVDRIRNLENLVNQSGWGNKVAPVVSTVRVAEHAKNVIPGLEYVGEAGGSGWKENKVKRKKKVRKSMNPVKETSTSNIFDMLAENDGTENGETSEDDENVVKKKSKGTGKQLESFNFGKGHPELANPFLFRKPSKVMSSYGVGVHQPKIKPKKAEKNDDKAPAKEVTSALIDKKAEDVPDDILSKESLESVGQVDAIEEIVLVTDKDNEIEQNPVIEETVDTAEIANMLKSSQAKAPPITEEDDEIKSKAEKIIALLESKKTENDIFT